MFVLSNTTPTPVHYTLSLHDALPICRLRRAGAPRRQDTGGGAEPGGAAAPNGGGPRRSDRAGPGGRAREGDRKSTRLNSSHLVISYAVFCLKKKIIHIIPRIIIL